MAGQIAARLRKAVSVSTIRVRKDSNYSCINNQPLRDSALSWGARGMLAYLLSMPDSWETNYRNLMDQGTEGQHRVLGYLKELEEHGYVVRAKNRTAVGRWEWVIDIHENPQKPNESPCVDSPRTEPSCTEKPRIHKVLKDQVLNSIPPLPPESVNALPYNSPLFVEAWSEFAANRKQLGKKLTPLSVKRLAVKMSKWTEQECIDAMVRSIENGWTGIFEPLQSKTLLPEHPNAYRPGKMVW